MDIDQLDSESIRPTKKCDRKYSQSSQSSTGCLNSSVITNLINEKRNDKISTLSNTKSCDAYKGEGYRDIASDNWKSSDNTMLTKTSSSHLSCYDDNSIIIDSALKNKCENGNPLVPPTPNTFRNIKSEVKDEINDTSQAIQDVVDLAPHVVTKLNVSKRLNYVSNND